MENMKRELGIVMDPIGSINIKKDSTFAMMLAAQRRGWRLWYMELADLSLTPGQCLARMREVEVDGQAPSPGSASGPRRSGPWRASRRS